MSLRGRVGSGRVSLGAALGCGAALVLTSPVRADTKACYFTGELYDGGAPAIRCSHTRCSVDHRCPSVIDDIDMPECVGGFCTRSCSRLFVCENNGDCPALTVAGGASISGQCRCLEHPDGPGGSDCAGICIYPDDRIAMTYCPDGSGEISYATLARCHTTPGGELTNNYQAGDCDGDGCPNAFDPRPCEPDMDPCACDLTRSLPFRECPVSWSPPSALDAGLAACDAGVGPFDAGHGSVDASAPGPDADGSERDAAGADLDAGGSTDFDAGRNVEQDAGPNDRGLGFAGGGGCRCGVLGGRAPSLAAALLFSMLAAAGGLRRRRSTALRGALSRRRLRCSRPGHEGAPRSSPQSARRSLRRAR